MKFEYKGLADQLVSVELEEIDVKGVILHATPDRNIEGIKADSLKTGMPRVKCAVDIRAVFCTVPSENPSTDDLFRYYNNWSIVVIDTSLIPGHKWYTDFLASIDPSNNGSNKHIMTFEDIPASAITKILK